MLLQLLDWVFALGEAVWRFLVGGGAFGLLFYGLLVTRDYRKRKRFSDATRHLTQDELGVGLATNVAIVAAFVQGKTTDAHASKRAEAALVMATVLKEHLAAKANVFPGPRYLKSRRAVLRAAKRIVPPG